MVLKYDLECQVYYSHLTMHHNMGAVYKPKDLSKRRRKKIPDELAKDIVPGANDDGDEPTLNEKEREKDQ